MLEIVFAHEASNNLMSRVELEKLFAWIKVSSSSSYQMLSHVIMQIQLIISEKKLRARIYTQIPHFKQTPTVAPISSPLPFLPHFSFNSLKMLKARPAYNFNHYNVFKKNSFEAFHLQYFQTRFKDSQHPSLHISRLQRDSPHSLCVNCAVNSLNQTEKQFHHETFI
jgi:hypothetical protein